MDQEPATYPMVLLFTAWCCTPRRGPVTERLGTAASPLSHWHRGGFAASLANDLKDLRLGRAGRAQSEGSTVRGVGAPVHFSGERFISAGHVVHGRTLLQIRATHTCPVVRAQPPQLLASFSDIQ